MIEIAVKGTAIRPIIRGTVVDMPKKDLYIIKTDNGYFTVQDSEILSYAILAN